MYLEDDGYSSGASSQLSSKESLFSHDETNSSNTVVMLVMVIEVTNIEEQLASMKATMDKLLKEGAQKDAQIKCQNKQIADLIKKLEKQPIESSNKCLNAENSDDEYNYNEKSDNERKLKKDHSLGSISIE